MSTKTPIFAGYFFFAAAIWTPLLIGAAALLGEELLQTLFRWTSETILASAGVFLILAVVLRLVWAIVSLSGQRRFIGFWKRKLLWEFWPPWMAYLPLMPYLGFLMIRYRSFTLFTATNPGMPSGGFVGESKSEILCHLSRVEEAVADYAVISGHPSAFNRRNDSCAATPSTFL